MSSETESQRKWTRRNTGIKYKKRRHSDPEIVKSMKMSKIDVKYHESIL